jgi:hypothetical protein
MADVGKKIGVRVQRYFLECGKAVAILKDVLKGEEALKIAGHYL